MSKVFDIWNYSSNTKKSLSVCSFVQGKKMWVFSFIPQMWVISFILRYISSILLFAELLEFSRWESINEPFTDCEIDFYNFETPGNICISEGSKNQTALYCSFTADPKAVLLDKSYRITWISEECTTRHQLVLPPALCQISHVAWYHTACTEAAVPVPRTTTTHLSNDIAQDSGNFPWTDEIYSLLMKFIPEAGSPAAEPFPRDTSDHLAQTQDAYRESLLFHRLHG